MARKRNDPPMSLADALRRRMGEEMTQDDAAAELGVAQSQVGRWLNGTSLPSPANYPALMEFLDISENEIALMVHRSRRLTTPQRLDAIEGRLDQIEEALGIAGG